MKLTLIMLFLIVLTSCSSTPESQTIPKITFENGHNDEYSSEYRVFRRYACLDNVIYTSALISDRDLIKFGKIAEKIGFFDLSYDLPREAFEDTDDVERIEIVAPCPDYRIRVQYGSLDNTVTWECNHGAAPKSLEKLLIPLKNKLYNLKSVKNAPESECRYR